jgi:hypothetical protein
MEDLLPAIINGVIFAHEYDREQRIKQEEKRREEERIRIIRENDEKRKAEEKRKWGLLQVMAIQFNTYGSIKLLISKIRIKYENEIIADNKFKEWLEWAEQVNERNNPIDSFAFLSKFEPK